MKLTWSQVAIDDLDSIHDYIGLDAPDRATRFVRRLILAAEPLREFPSMGRVVPEGDGRYREVLFSPYRVIYRVEGESVLIVTVVHGARDLAALWRDSPPDTSPS